MTSREIVTRAIEFRNPPRLPINGTTDEISDFAYLPQDEIKPPEAQGNPDIDQWLCRWSHTELNNMGQVKGHPLEDLTKMKDFPWPDADDPRRYVQVSKRLDNILADLLRRDKYVTTGIIMILWERMHSLHGFENCMMDLMDDTPEINELADRIIDFDIALVRNLHRVCGSHLQMFDFTDDWGTQHDLQISPDLFRRFFQPRYTRLFKVIHECGWHVKMHSCGKINKAIPMLIEAGLDVINMQQPRTNGIEEIGHEFAGKICFESLCDIQTTLPGGDKDSIFQEAALLMKSWGTPRGGLILGEYGDGTAIGVSPLTRPIMLDAFLSQDPYKTGHWRI